MLAQIGVKIRILFHAAALQRINFHLVFTLTNSDLDPTIHLIDFVKLLDKKQSSRFARSST